MLGTLCKLPQYQSFKINTKFIHLILPQSSLGFVSLNNRRSSDVRLSNDCWVSSCWIYFWIYIPLNILVQLLILKKTTN
jgi:hypothetical protein